jgi:hypothetical protein
MHIVVGGKTHAADLVYILMCAVVIRETFFRKTRRSEMSAAQNEDANAYYVQCSVKKQCAPPKKRDTKQFPGSLTTPDDVGVEIPGQIDLPHPHFLSTTFDICTLSYHSAP